MPSDGVIRISYFQEIMPGEATQADFRVDPVAISERSDGIPPGDYVSGPLQGTFSLDVASFDRWRRLLAPAALNFEAEKVWSNPDVFRGEPFFELIQCEKKSVFGPVTSQKLAEDFQNLEQTVEEKIASKVEFEEFQFFMEVYQLFKKAFSVSSNGGCTVFESEH